jgi:hypothetical protein
LLLAAVAGLAALAVLHYWMKWIEPPYKWIPVVIIAGWVIQGEHRQRKANRLRSDALAKLCCAKCGYARTEGQDTCPECGHDLNEPIP